MQELGLKLRALRKARGMSLRELADRVGCSPSYLSMVENARLDPSISRLKRIAEGLQTTIRGLFQDEPGEDIILRRADRRKVNFAAARLRIEPLVPQQPAKLMDARLAIVAPGGGSDGDYQHPGEEFGLIMEGTLDLTVQGVFYRLEAGDSFYFPSHYQHSFRNTSDHDTVVVWVNCPPSW